MDFYTVVNFNMNRMPDHEFYLSPIDFMLYENQHYYRCWDFEESPDDEETEHAHENTDYILLKDEELALAKKIFDKVREENQLDIGSAWRGEHIEEEINAINGVWHCNYREPYEFKKIKWYEVEGIKILYLG